MKLTWLKLAVDILDDHKIKRVRALPGGDSLFVCWIALLSIAMRSHVPGALMISDTMALDVDDLAIAAGVTRDTAALALATFTKLGMVTQDDAGTMVLTKFREHQSLDQIEYRRAQDAARQARHRQIMREKQGLLEDMTPGAVTRDTPVTPALQTPSRSRIKNKKEKEKKKSKPAPAAPKPACVHVASAAEQAYIDGYQEAMRTAPVMTASMVIRINKVCRDITPDVFFKALPGFFANDYARGAGYDVGLLQSNPNKYLHPQAGGAAPGSRPTMNTGAQHLAIAHQVLNAMGKGGANDERQ